jgi:type I restriction enzyme M protein
MKKTNENKIGDFYWAYADILRGIGINESMYDQRIMAFMALKLLVDNELVIFNFDYKKNFGLPKQTFLIYKGTDTKETLVNIINDIKQLGSGKLQYFIQDKNYNIDGEDENILYYINHKKTFPLISYIEELENSYLEMVLDIYIQKANFKDYPKEEYKNLYETAISRMKKLSGDLMGQHFTQKSIIHLMCEHAIEDLKKSKSDILAIYDPACGTGSMLMESAYYFDKTINYTEKGSKRKNLKNITVYGQEMHGQTWLLCKIFLEISQIQNTIAHGNTLTNPAFDKINGDNSFDFIIANPPFGVDWKHDYDKVIVNMKKEQNSNFFVIKDNNKIITPKKSDGQFLFMQHIINLLQVSKKHGKDAKAVVISSTGLITSGKETSAEGIIRKKIFQDGWVDTLLEQPKAMFTNTDISTLLWFLDNKQTKQNQVYLIKTDNSYINKHFESKELKVLYTTARIKKDKQKNSYSDKNIVTIAKLLQNKQEFSLFSKWLQFDEKYTINFENELHYDIDTSSVVKNTFNIEESYHTLCLALMFSDEISNKYSNFKEVIDKLSSYIEGGFVDEFYEDYANIYQKVCQMMQKNQKNINKKFQDMVIAQKQKEFENIDKTFKEIEYINTKVKISLEIV